MRVIGVNAIPQLAQMLGVDLKGMQGEGAGLRAEYNAPFFNPNIGSNQNWTLMEPKGKG